MGGKKKREKLMTLISITVKLFIIMGVSWTLEIVSAWMHHTGEYSSILIAVLDTLNLLTGIPIFFALVAKPKVLKEIRKQLCVATLSGSAKYSNSSSNNSGTDNDAYIQEMSYI